MARTLDPKEHNHLLRLENAQRKARLAAADLELPPALPAALHRLTAQQVAVYQLLADAKGRCLTRFQSECAVPARDHAEDRSYHLVDVIACRIRQKLGADVVVNELGKGYRLGRAVA